MRAGDAVPPVGRILSARPERFRALPSTQHTTVWIFFSTKTAVFVNIFTLVHGTTWHYLASGTRTCGVRDAITCPYKIFVDRFTFNFDATSSAVRTRLNSRPMKFSKLPPIEAHAIAYAAVQWLLLVHRSAFVQMATKYDRTFAGCIITREISANLAMESLMPFEQLTSLKIDHSQRRLQKPDVIVGLLQRCSHVVVLELQVPWGLEFSPASPIILPLLRSLAIKSGGDNMGPLCHISAPFLEDLSLSWPYNLTTNLRRLCDEVADFQQNRSSSTLSSLTIKEIRYMRKEEVRMLLSAFPFIKLFRIMNYKYKDDIFRSLTLKGSESMSGSDSPRNPEPVLLPHLTHLEVLGFYSDRHWDRERKLLRDMICSRWRDESEEPGHNEVACLQKVTLDRASELDAYVQISHILVDATVQPVT
ncbi:hypothetical protein BDP27DRAFT_1371814 [Rhodocollybia butyracea]|uniref:Uncharacterized protein n=1 Tax=Rhodocollybia butyracea TaxID=206335 RepID=A0A9P5TXU6_9AGAR|nr:hypothetical protein BDP27DRAFT_1371814 [Rhodocollybia butyracea]